MLAFLLRCANQKKEVKEWVENRLKSSDYGKTIQRRAGVLQGTRKRPQKEFHENEKNKVWRELAALEAEHRGLRHMGDIKLGKDKLRLRAYSRLKVLLPNCKDTTIWKIMEHSPHEEAAVARLLALGYAMWQVQGYKDLSCALAGGTPAGMAAT